MPRKKTAFDRYFDKRMQDPEFAAAYKAARTVIDSTDAIIRAFDQARLLAGITKADLAARIAARPEVVRRLFTTKHSNPTLSSVLKLAKALDLHLELVPNQIQSNRRARERDRVAAH